MSSFIYRGPAESTEEMENKQINKFKLYGNVL